MTLRMQFDDLVHGMEQINEINAASEEDAMKCALLTRELNEKYVELEAERRRLEKIAEEKEKILQTLQTKLQVERMKCEEEHQKISTLTRERDALDKVLSEARKVIMGHDDSNVQLKSLLDSISTISDQ